MLNSGSSNALVYSNAIRYSLYRSCTVNNDTGHGFRLEKIWRWRIRMKDDAQRSVNIYRYQSIWIYYAYFTIAIYLLVQEWTTEMLFTSEYRKRVWCACFTVAYQSRFAYRYRYRQWYTCLVIHFVQFNSGNLTRPDQIRKMQRYNVINRCF